MHFLVPLKNGINSVVDQLVTRAGAADLARRRRSPSAAIAGVLAGWRMAVARRRPGSSRSGCSGLWADSLDTLALVLLSVAVALAIGIPVGILCRPDIRALEQVLRPVLDAMQTVPAFSYLVPLVLLFSIGATTAMIATVIFALPPAIRLTSLGIRHVPDDVDRGRRGVRRDEAAGACARSSCRSPSPRSCSASTRRS